MRLFLPHSGLQVYDSPECGDHQAGRVSEARGQAESFRRLEDVGERYHRHEDSGHHSDEMLPAAGVALPEVHSAGPEGDHGESLVGPGEIAPDDVEVDLRERAADGEQRNSEVEAFYAGYLVELEPVSQGVAGASKCRIA